MKNNKNKSLILIALTMDTDHNFKMIKHKKAEE